MVEVAADQDSGFPPGVHHRLAVAGENMCQSCAYYRDAGYCDMFHARTLPIETCDEWTDER